MALVSFKRGTLANWGNVSPKDPNTLYFVEMDSAQKLYALYLGENLVADGLKLNNAETEIENLKTLIGDIPGDAGVSTVIEYIQKVVAEAEVAVDDRSIENKDGVLQIKGADTATNGMALRMGATGIEWYTPDTSTVEGLQQTVGQLQTDLDDLETTVGDSDSGLVKTVNDLSTNLTTNYYNKTEVDTKLSSVYKFKGNYDTLDALNAAVADGTITPEPGFVYNISQAGGVDDKGVAIKAGDNVACLEFTPAVPEGAAASAKWDVLAGTVDLSAYATTESVASAIKTATGELGEKTVKQYVDEAVEAIDTTIPDGSITKEKLDSEVQASLDKADSALQKASITTGTAQGTINVDGSDVAVNGLAALAYKDKVSKTDLDASLTAELDGKATKGTTLAEYGITDAYTKTEVYTKAEVDDKLTWGTFGA